MNTVQEIRRINEAELASGSSASWHDQYKDSAYIHVGGLPFNLTEGDVITIFSQYGEIVDISMPRDPNTQKPRGFAFVMYADQRSTVLAVDNLNGAKVLQRTLKVDHVLNYKQLERDQETGKMKERDAPSLAAHPERFLKQAGAAGSDNDDDAGSDSSHPSIDPDDPMRDYLIEQRRAARKAGGGGGKKRKHDGESKEQRRARREEKRRIKEERAKRKAIKAEEDHDDGHGSRSRDRDHERRGAEEHAHKHSNGRPRSESPRRRPRDVEDRAYDRRDLDRDSKRSHDRDRERGDDSHRRRQDDRQDDDRRREGRMSAFADLEKWAEGR